MERGCSRGIAYRWVISEIVTLLSPSEALGISVTHTTIELVSVGVNSKVVVPWAKDPSARIVPPCGSSGLVARIWTCPPFPVPWSSMAETRAGEARVTATPMPFLESIVEEV